MVLRAGLYKPNHFRVLYHRCEGCGHPFSEGEKIFKRIRGAKVRGYLCESCYQKKFIDL